MIITADKIPPHVFYRIIEVEADFERAMSPNAFVAGPDVMGFIAAQYKAYLQRGIEIGLLKLGKAFPRTPSLTDDQVTSILKAEHESINPHQPYEGPDGPRGPGESVRRSGELFTDVRERTHNPFF